MACNKKSKNCFVFSLTLLQIVASITRESFAFQYKSYNNVIVCNASYPFTYPNDLYNIQSIVRDAITKKMTIKPLGNLHSATDIICSDGVPISMKNIRHFPFHRGTGLVTVGAGETLSGLTKKLHNLERALEGMPAYGDITIGGAIGTSAHGSSLKYLTTLSDQMVSVVFVDGAGTVVNTSDTNILNAFKTHLGLLGVIYEVTFRTVPQYKVHFRNSAVSETILMDVRKLVEKARSLSFFQFWWLPSIKQVVLFEGKNEAVNLTGECRTKMIHDFPGRTVNYFRSTFENADSLELYLHQLNFMLFFIGYIPGVPFYTSSQMIQCSPAIGFSQDMLSNTCANCLWGRGGDSMDIKEHEIIIPLTELSGALETIKEIFADYSIPFYMGGLFFRFMTPSKGLLSLNRNVEAVAIGWEFLSPPEKFNKASIGIAARQAVLQALMELHQGVAHWGKNGLYYFSLEMIHRQHHRFQDEFISYMEKFDPNGIFLNDFGRRLRFSHHKITSDPNFSHCALNDDCRCFQDSDCGDGSVMNFYCARFYNFPVCAENERPFLKRLKRRRQLGITLIKNMFEPILTNYLEGEKCYAKASPGRVTEIYETHNCCCNYIWVLLRKKDNI